MNHLDFSVFHIGINSTLRPADETDFNENRFTRP